MENSTAKHQLNQTFPSFQVQEGEAQEAADVPEEIAEAAADTKVPEGVLEGQEEIADDAVPETEEEGSSAEPVPETEPMEEEAQEGAAAPSDMQPDQSYLAPGGIPAGMKIVAAIQQPYAAKPPMNVVSSLCCCFLFVLSTPSLPDSYLLPRCTVCVRECECGYECLICGFLRSCNTCILYTEKKINEWPEKVSGGDASNSTRSDSSTERSDFVLPLLEL